MPSQDTIAVLKKKKGAEKKQTSIRFNRIRVKVGTSRILRRET